MRRLPSQFAALSRLLDEHIRVEAIAEPLYAVGAQSPASDLMAYLDQSGFDECGVHRNGRVTESVRRDKLGPTGAVGECAALVPLERVVASEAPLWPCMDRIVQRGPLFVLGHDGLDGIVTVADLHKQPAGVLMIGVISMLEMVILQMIRRRFDGDDWKSALSPGRIDKAEALFRERQRIGEEIDLADCLQLCDKRDICLHSPDILAIWKLDANGADKVFDSLQRIRDNLAHAQSPAPTGDWAAVVETLRLAKDILQRSLDGLSDPSEVHA